MRTRWSAYAGASVALAGVVVVKALAQRPNFYSAAVYLAQSNANLMILTNMSFVVACSCLLGLQKLLYGPLRPIEIEQLYEKAWIAVTETCLAMTIFRGEIGAWFLVMFFALLAGKVWAWIGEGRVEILEQQPPRNPRLFHTRLALSLGLSVFFDLTMLEFVVSEVMQMARPDMMVMFGFEFAVLSIVSLSTAARYAINLSEIMIVKKQKAKEIEKIRKERVETAIRAAEATTEAEVAPATEAGQSSTAAAVNAAREAASQPIDEADIEVEGWEGKGRWMFYLDLTTDFCKLVVYLSFFFILLIFYGLPIHILRDVFLTCRSFFKRIADFVRYRNATRDMNERYPDATEQDIGREDVCIICREEMRPYEPAAEGQQANPVAERMRPKKLPCGHVLHFACLRSWLERQQICPTCRTSVTPTPQPATAQQGAVGDPPAQGQNLPAPGAARARGGLVRLGPLRIAFGAARGNNMMGDLQNQLRGNDAQPAQPAQPAANPEGPQQYGFGIRWEGMRRRERPRGQRTIQDQLNAAERQIQQELNSLGNHLAELQILRSMEAELARLRLQRAAVNGTQTPSLLRTFQSMPPATGAMSQTQLVGDSSGRLDSGHPNLPAGLTLPDGWTMMPLSPTQGIQQGSHILNQATTSNGASGTISSNLGTTPSAEETLQAIPSTSASQAVQHTQQPTGQADSAGSLVRDVPQPTPTININNTNDSSIAHNRTVEASPLSGELTEGGPASSISQTPVPASASALSGTDTSSASPVPSLPNWGPNPGSVFAPSVVNSSSSSHQSENRTNGTYGTDQAVPSSAVANGESSGNSSSSSTSSSPATSKGHKPTVEESHDDSD